MPPFDGNGNGNGLAIKSWLLSPYKDGNSGAKWICVNYLGMSEDEYDEWSAKEDVFLNVEAVMWAGVFTNSEASSFTGKIFIGNATSWANRVSPSQFIGRYSHRYMPEGMHYDKDFMCLSKANTTQSKHSAAEICSPVGWGIITVKPKEGDKQLIKVYMTGAEIDGTSYSYCNDIVSLKDEGSYKLKQWETSSKVYNGSYGDRDDYNKVRSEGHSDAKRSGTGATNLVLSGEKTVYALYVQETPPPVVGMGDKLLADELNFVFSTFSNYDGARDGFRKSPAHFPDIGRFTTNLFAEDAYIEAKAEVDNDRHKRNFLLDPPDSYEIGEERSGAVVDLNGEKLHYYNENYQLWRGYAESKIFVPGETVVANYARNVSRYLWEPELKMCEYRNEALDDIHYAEEYLKITKSNIGTLTSVGGASPNATNTAEERTDTYTFDFTGKVNYTYEQERYHFDPVYTNGIQTGTTEVSDGWDLVSKTLAATIESITSSCLCDKYRVKSTPLANNPKAGTVAFKDEKRPHNGGHSSINLNGNSDMGALNTMLEKQTFITQFGKLNINPEIPMYIYKQEGTTLSSLPHENPTFVMGEIMRKCVPVQIHGYVTGLNRGSEMEGISTLPSASTGSNAKALYDSFNATASAGDEVVGGTAMGTSFESSTDNEYRVELWSFALDCLDDASESKEGHGGSAVRSAWQNSGYNPEESHNAFVSVFDSNTEAELLLQPYNASGQPQADTYRLVTEASKRKYTEFDVETIPLVWRHGAVQNKAEVIAKLNVLGDGSTIYANSGIDEQLNLMFISDSDADTDNKSKLGQWMQETHGGNWYDEESVCMCIRVYHTRIDYGQLIADDKLDYSMKGLSQLLQKQSRYEKGVATTGVLCKIFSRIYFKEPESITIDGYTFAQDPPHIRVDHVKGSDFVLSNSTTSNMRK